MHCSSEEPRTELLKAMEYCYREAHVRSTVLSLNRSISQRKQCLTCIINILPQTNCVRIQAYRMTTLLVTVSIRMPICELAFLTHEASTFITSFNFSDTARANDNRNGRNKCTPTCVVSFYAYGTIMARNEGAQKCRSAQLKNLPGAHPP